MVLSGEGDRVEEQVGAAREAAGESRPADASTLWDLASLTKPLAGAALVLALVEAKALELDDELCRFHDLFRRTKFEGVTLRRLLAHASGLPAWFPCYVRGEGRDAYRRTLAALDLEAAPGARAGYSCLGYLLLADVVERASSLPLEKFLRDRVTGPLGLSADLLFAPEGDDLARCSGGERDDATERRMCAELGLSYGGFRGGIVNGEVNDGNALRRFGGVSLNAGLFGTARAVAEAGRAWMLRDPRLLPEGLVEEATAAHPEAPGYGLGWRLATAGGATGGALASEAFGHTGFTGTSLWVDPEARRVFVLLFNRLHPDARDVDANGLRRRFHDLASAL